MIKFDLLILVKKKIYNPDSTSKKSNVLKFFQETITFIIFELYNVYLLSLKCYAICELQKTKNILKS